MGSDNIANITEKKDLPPNFYLKLFMSTFLISAFTVGGGFVIIPLLKAKFVDEYGWLDEHDTMNLVSIAQSMPGVVAVNAAIILGYRMAGIKGTLTTLLATILPPLIMLSAISVAYDAFAENIYARYLLKGMQCGATALIVKVAYDLLKKEAKAMLLLPLGIIAATFVASYFFGVNIMLLVLIDGFIGFMFMRDVKYGK